MRNICTERTNIMDKRLDSSFCLSYVQFQQHNSLREVYSQNCSNVLTNVLTSIVCATSEEVKREVYHGAFFRIERFIFFAAWAASRRKELQRCLEKQR